MKVRKFNESSSLIESSNGKFYWKLNIKEPYMSIGLKNIGCPKGTFDFLNTDIEVKKRYGYDSEVLICCGDYPVHWDWVGNADEKFIWEWCDNEGYIYMGVVPVSEEEVDDWNMKYDMVKYNL